MIVFELNNEMNYVGDIPMVEDKVKFFKALSDSNRLRILKILQTRPLCVCEITNVLELATSTVSQHLKILKEAGFIIEEKEGKWVNYLINTHPFGSKKYPLPSFFFFFFFGGALFFFF